MFPGVGWGPNEETKKKYEEDLAFEAVYKILWEKHAGDATTDRSATKASSLKVKRNVTRCGEPAFTAYEMYLNHKLSSPPPPPFFLFFFLLQSNASMVVPIWALV